ncbi:hypothetical protein [Streptomyces marianii]|uniref:Acyl-CoA dehydrogenase/oxidase C-terminal domain-containing protein n=1 Tax=Streptomyces marianii TaxID=1817406 RepID=A0A5R9EFK4_9ACTN|nr:hypothetical protein [Streptomyces marianii]TLQ47867.1 hypothetical protein FEF34_37560 [Streptomyces marianii]
MTSESEHQPTGSGHLASHRRIDEVARTYGARQAFEELYRAYPEGTLLRNPAGHAVVPSGRLPGADDLLPEPLRGCGLVIVRDPSAPQPAWPADTLVRLRLGLSRALLDACLTYLGQRTVHGAPLLHQQLIGGALADAVTEQTEIESVLMAPSNGPDALGDLHRQISTVDRGLLRLLGAFGFTAEGPGRTALLSELIADVYGCHHQAEQEGVQ